MPFDNCKYTFPGLN